MPKQLIYTSWPQGLVPGKSGYCVVGMTDGLRDPLRSYLQRLSFYAHSSLPGKGGNPTVLAYRCVELQSAVFHILTQIRDCSPDYTGGSNFIAHHLAFEPEEIRGLPSPAVILLKWPGWMSAWHGNPCYFPDDIAASFRSPELLAVQYVPAKTWKNLTRDAVNAAGLLSMPATFFGADGLSDEQILALFAESCEMLQVVSPPPEAPGGGTEFRTGAWQFRFTTFLQEQDNPSEFRWRCVHSASPAAQKLRAGRQTLVPFQAVRFAKPSQEAVDFAEQGRQALQITSQPEDRTVKEGESAEFFVRAAGIPYPKSYQWFCREPHGGERRLSETTDRLCVSEVTRAQNHTQYWVEVSRKGDMVKSNLATLNVTPKLWSRRRDDPTVPNADLPEGYANLTEALKQITQNWQDEGRLRLKERRLWIALAVTQFAAMLVLLGMVFQAPLNAAFAWVRENPMWALIIGVLLVAGLLVVILIVLLSKKGKAGRNPAPVSPARRHKPLPRSARETDAE
jgi:hypothetical protein